MRYKLPFNDVVSGAVADTFRTILGIIAANTAGYRGCVRAFQVGPSDDAPLDLQAALRFGRTNNATAGTPLASIAAASIPKVDPASRDTIMTATRGLYTAEPTTYETEYIFQMEFNLRGGFIKEWEFRDGPKFGINQTLGVLVTPRTAAAIRLSGCIEYEEW